MNAARPHPRFAPTLLLVCALAALPAAYCQTSLTSAISGVVQTTAPAHSDTLLSTPLARPAVWIGAAASVNGNRITVATTPGWATDQFVRAGTQSDTFFARLRTGALRGQFFTIAGNDAASLLLDAAGLDLSLVQPGDEFEIAPYWTLGTLYPASQAGASFIATDSVKAIQTELRFYGYVTADAAPVTTSVYFFYRGAWRKAGESLSASFDHVVVLPDSYYVQRNKNTGTALAFAGRVLTHSIGTVLEVQAQSGTSNEVALAYPVDVTLRRSDLANAITATTSPGAIADRVLLFDTTKAAINRKPSASYFYYDGGWRQEGASLTRDFSDAVRLPSAGGFIVRRAPGGSTSTWTFETGL